MKRVVVLVAVLAAACSGSTTGPTANKAYEETMQGSVSSFGTTSHNLTTPRGGNLTISLSSTSAGDLDLYLTPQGCTTPTACTMLAKSDSAGGSERILRTVTNGEAFKVWVDNFETRPMNYSLSIRIE